MSMERKLLAACVQSRTAWEAVRGVLDSKSELSPEAGIIFELIREYYEVDSKAKRCDQDILAERAKRQINSNKASDIVVSAIIEAGGLDVSAINVAREVVDCKKAALGNKIASYLASGEANKGKQAKELMNDYIKLDQGLVGEGSESEDTFTGVKASSLVQTSFSAEGLIQLYPLALNNHIDGGLRGGHHILVFAPTEMGKSLLVINFIYGFLKQGLKVLMIENEDPASDTLMRVMTRLTLMPKYEILANPDIADGILSRRNWDKFVLANLAPGTPSRIEQLCEIHRPQVLVTNQLRNIDVGVDQRTQALEKAATWSRNLAKSRNIPVVSVTQAADSASGKTILGRGDVDGSNIGIPGQIDLMLGIGATPEMEDSNYRVLSFAKNKLSGRHDPLTIQIDPFTSRVVE